MKTITKPSPLSEKRVRRIREQGYLDYSDQEIRNLAFGNRFANRLCIAFLLPGVLFANLPILITINSIALASVVMPNHPFDYVYNHFVRKFTKGPRLPLRSPQLKFACGLASILIASTIYFFYNGMMLAGYAMGLHIVGVASLVALFDLCIPSKVFNFLVGIKIK